MLDKHSILALFLGLERVESIPNQRTNKEKVSQQKKTCDE
jgi:hypothetical protein